MKSKTIITAVLLSFVAVSVAYLVGKETGLLPSFQPTDEPAVESGVVMYYFHSNKRCNKCNTMQAYTVAAMENGFAGQLADGSLAMRVANTDDPANEHFKTDFELVTGSVVLAKYADGECVDWELLRTVNDPLNEADFTSYVQGETRRFLEMAE